MKQYALLWGECEDDINNEDAVILKDACEVLAVIETDDDFDLEAKNTGAREGIDGSVEYIIRVKEKEYIPNLTVIEGEE